ncbi:MAG: VOC family protein, partial [Actinomycetota bacterium]
DLGGADPARARRFYGGLLGWEFEDVGQDGGDPYTLARLDGRIVAGMHTHPGQDVAPHWDSYIAVADADAALERVRELGGEVAVGPFDIPGTARGGVIADPSGARVGLWQATGFPGAEAVNETGTWTWNDLLTREPDEASAFFEGLFGWKTERVVDVYASFTMGDLLIGGMRTIAPEETTPPSWMPYFVVEDADLAAGRLEELGGGVLIPPTAVPSGRFLVFHDGRGAPAGLVEMGPEGPARGVDLG